MEALEQDYQKPKKYKTPYREVSIIVTKEGYYPKNLSVFQGEKVRFFITNTSDEPSCLIIDEKEVYLSARKGKVSETEVYFQKPGKWKFYCPTGKIKGSVVAIKKESKKKKLRRAVASKRTRIWMPRDE